MLFYINGIHIEFEPAVYSNPPLPKNYGPGVSAHNPFATTLYIISVYVTPQYFDIIHIINLYIDSTTPRLHD